MRWAMGTLVAVATAAALAAAPGPGVAQRLVLVGTYTNETSRGIYAFRFDEVTGRLTSAGLAAETPSPSFLAARADGRVVFAVNEASTYGSEPSGSVTSFRVDPASARLTAITTVSSRGAHPCHLALDRSQRFLAVANYTGGTFALIPVAGDGTLSPASAVFGHQGSGPNRTRQNGPHAHAVLFEPSGQYLLGADLGLDRVHVYRFDAASGRLAPHVPVGVATAPGGGPRHLALHPTEPLVFVLAELTSTIESFSWDQAAGRLTPLGTYPMLPAGFAGDSTGAEVEVHASGRFLYASNRGHDSIAVFSVSGDGRLAIVEHEPTRGRTPRHFTIDPTGRWLIAANQQSNTLSVFAIDQTTGRLSPAGPVVDTPTPVSVLFVP